MYRFSKCLFKNYHQNCIPFRVLFINYVDYFKYNAINASKLSERSASAQLPCTILPHLHPAQIAAPRLRHQEEPA